MRVALFLPGLAGGGAERSMLIIAEQLRGRGHTVELLTALGDGDLEPPEGLPHVCFEVKHARSAIPGLVRYLRQQRPDVLVTALDHGNFAAVAASELSFTRTPVVVSYHSHLSTAARGGGRQRLRPAAARMVMSRASLVVAVSEKVATDLRHIAPRATPRIRDIGNPIVGDQLFAASAEPLHDGWLGARTGPILLSVGRLADEKCYDLLLDAFALVLEARPDAGLVILGQGPLREELQAQAEGLGISASLHLPGFQKNPYPYMLRADVFVLSSRREGLPTVLIEAGVLGASLVSTDCPAGPREILSGKPNAQLVPMDDVKALADAMLTGIERGRRPVDLALWTKYGVETSGDHWEQALEAAAANAS